MYIYIYVYYSFYSYKYLRKVQLQFPHFTEMDAEGGTVHSDAGRPKLLEIWKMQHEGTWQFVG